MKKLKVLELGNSKWTIAVVDEKGKEIVYNDEFRKPSLGKNWKEEVVKGVFKGVVAFTTRDFKLFEDPEVELYAIFNLTKMVEFTMLHMELEDILNQLRQWEVRDGR